MMKTILRKIFPHPFLTLLLAVVWTLLQNNVSAGMVVFGLILGVIIPALTARWWPDRPDEMRLIPMIKYIGIVIWDIIVANIQVAKTPGTVSADLSNEGHSLLVHALDAPDPDVVRDEIKERYERRLLEIFQ